mmetsp:Transcript_126528/g.369721  ORF Transcript_126528/g.369721 Transcript_126528/m.369721 type:complete len:308 (-) Transcript_126528:21-944(-)
MKESQNTLPTQVLFLLVSTTAALGHRGNSRSSSGSRSGSSTDVNIGGGGIQQLASRQAGLTAQQLAASSEKSWNLRICNAYGFKSGLDAFHSPLPPVSGPRPEPSRLTRASGPLPYKRCADLRGVEGLGPGSVLSFRLGGGLPIGSFRVEELPVRGSLLQLVVCRYDTASTAASFSSHVFSDDIDPEVALIDAYRGKDNSGLAVRSTVHQWQDVHFGKAISLKPGWYEWALTGDHANRGDEAVGFRMNYYGKYTAIRVGVDASHGPSYTEELVMFPTSWITVYSFACRSSSMYTFALLLGVWWSWFH